MSVGNGFGKYRDKSEIFAPEPQGPRVKKCWRREKAANSYVRASGTHHSAMNIINKSWIGESVIERKTRSAAQERRIETLSPRKAGFSVTRRESVICRGRVSER